MSPRKIENRKLEIKLQNCRDRLDVANKKISKLKNDVSTLTNTVKELKKQQNFSENIDQKYESVPTILINRYLKILRKEAVSHETYPPALKEFACTLYCYSKDAYEFVRQEFKSALPDQATIRKWRAKESTSNPTDTSLEVKKEEKEDDDDFYWP